MSNAPGFVYILTNKAFKEDWVKIGKTSKSVEERVNSLDCTSTPLPFDIYATIKTKKYNELEKVIHHTFDNLTELRIRSNREFFNIKPDDALTLIQDIALPLIDDAEVNLYADSMDNDTEDPDDKTEHSNTADDTVLLGIKAGLSNLFSSNKEKYANWSMPYFYHKKLVFSNRKKAVLRATTGNSLTLAIDVNCVKGNEYINVFLRKDARDCGGVNRRVDHTVFLPLFSQFGFTVQNTKRNHKGKLHLKMVNVSVDVLKNKAVEIVKFIEDNLSNMQNLVV